MLTCPSWEWERFFFLLTPSNTQFQLLVLTVLHSYLLLSIMKKTRCSRFLLYFSPHSRNVFFISLWSFWKKYAAGINIKQAWTLCPKGVYVGIFRPCRTNSVCNCWQHCCVTFFFSNCFNNSATLTFLWFRVNPSVIYIFFSLMLPQLLRAKVFCLYLFR